MRFLKKLFTALGVLFCLLLVVLGSLFYVGTKFKGEHEMFVREFISDYSRSWDTSDVHARLSAEFLEQIQSPNGLEAVALFRRLGKVLEVTDVSLNNFFVRPSETSGEFVFKARFENAPAVVRLSIRESDGQPRVLGLHITPSSELPQAGSGPARI